MSGSDDRPADGWTPEDLRRVFAPLNGPRQDKPKQPAPREQARSPDEDEPDDS